MTSWKLLLCVLLTSVTQALFGATNDFMTLTATDGREIVAKPINVIQGKIRIKREDGSEFNVTPDMFELSDAKFLQDWMINYLIEGKRFLSLNARKNSNHMDDLDEKNPKLPTYKDDSMTKPKPSTSRRSRMPYGEMMTRHSVENTEPSPYGYQVEIENESGTPIQGLVIKYKAEGKDKYYTKESRNLPDGTTQYYKLYHGGTFSISGSFSGVSVPAYGNIMLLTKPLGSSMFARFSRATKGYKYDFIGIKMEIYLDGKLLFTHTEPRTYD